MRVGTLDDPDTLAFLRERFVLVTHNQLPELYCSTGTVDATAPVPYPAAQVANATEGAGGGNVRSFFCTPDGHVVSYVAGLWKPARYLEEARWALARMGDDKAALGRAHADRTAVIERERDAAASPADVTRLLAEMSRKADPNDPEVKRRFTLFRRITAFNRLSRSHREAADYACQAVGDVLRRIEDEVYIKGAIGCDS